MRRVGVFSGNAVLVGQTPTQPPPRAGEGDCGLRRTDSMVYGMTWHPEDAKWMEMALRHGVRHIGRAMPNTSVGAVIVKDGRLLAAATTGIGGRPHAETQALALAGEQARGATLYVTLEPCAHTGKTPPCAQAVIDAGVARVLIAIGDPDARVAGKGIAMLRDAGIVVGMAPLPYAVEASEQHRGFFKHRRTGRPYVAMKLATSLEGAVATAAGESQWITGPQARNHAQQLRARYDAWLTGITTVLMDDPLLTCRLPGLEQASPIRIVADSQFRLPETTSLLESKAPLWVLVGAEALAAQPDKAEAMKARGVEVLPCRMDGERLDLDDAMQRLGRQGVTRLMVEAGPVLSSNLWQKKMIERVYWYRAPIVLGRGARLALQPELSPPHSTSILADLPRWRCESRQVLGPDQLEIFTPAEGGQA